MRPSLTVCIALTIALLGTPTPAAALDWELPDLGWEGSRAETATAMTVDLAIVRPIASARFLVGAVMFVPAYLASLPMGREGFDGAYDTLIAQPAEFAFVRKVGEF